MTRRIDLVNVGLLMMWSWMFVRVFLFVIGVDL